MIAMWLNNLTRPMWQRTLCAACMALACLSVRHVAVTPGELHGEAPSAEIKREVVTVTAVSEPFLLKIERENETIPDNVWIGLHQAGWKLQVAEFVVDAMPSLKGVQPRNWPMGMTWENTDALHLPKSRLLVLAEKRKNRKGKVVASTRVGGALRHEVGHAFDMAAAKEFPFCSGHPDFLVAYHRDTSSLSEAEQKKLAYYVTRDQAGRQEAFAEAFALILGGGSDERQQEMFRRCFPRVIQYVRDKIDNYRPKKVAILSD